MPDLALERTFTHYRLPGLHYWSYVVHLHAFPTGWQPILSTPASLCVISFFMSPIVCQLGIPSLELPQVIPLQVE